jgi:hypothetical protein
VKAFGKEKKRNERNCGKTEELFFCGAVNWRWEFEVV